jgi:ParB family chromosome partitioning protein
MTPRHILIVEPDVPLALSVAACFREEGYGTAVAGGAGEAELEIASNRPDLVVVRAELPDLSGFSLCARLRHDRATERLAVILYSSETAPTSLAEHARTPWAASGYLAMPLDTTALTAMARHLLQAQEPVELADDAIVEELSPEEAAGGVAPSFATGAAPSGAPSAAAVPPRLPGRPRRDALTEEDRLFVGRVFQSIGDRRDELAAEAERRRPPPRRDLLGSPEGRLSLLRDDLKWREAQLARLGELWETREREVASADDRVHAAAVEAQAARGESEDLRRRLAQAHAQLEEKERAYGASIEGLLLEKFKDEKDLIEVVAATERQVHERGRELRASEEARAAVEAELSSAQARVAALEAEGREARARVAGLEGQVDGLDRSLREAAERIAVQVEEVEARDELIRGARREVERLHAELSAARQALMLRETELRGEIGRVRAEAAEVASGLAQAAREREEHRERAASLAADLSASRAESEGLGEALSAAREAAGRLDQELTAARQEATGLAAELEAARSPAAAAEVPDWIAEAAAAPPTDLPSEAPAPAAAPDATATAATPPPSRLAPA